MNTNNVVAATLAQLQQQLQALHVALGAPATQNVRNVEPAHVTIISCLPTKQANAITADELWKRFVAKGGMVKRSSFNMVLSKMTEGSVFTIRFNNAPFLHYYFSY